MARYKNTDNHSYRKTECRLCGEQVTDRKSEAVMPEDKRPGDFVLVKGANGSVVMRRAMPRQHRKGLGCRAPQD